MGSLLALTSDFPSTPSPEIVQLIRSRSPEPSIAWLPPQTSSGREHFQQARIAFGALGVGSLHYCDIDEEPNERQLDSLSDYDVIYLSGGDPLAFCRSGAQVQLPRRLNAYLKGGGFVLAASAGAMFLSNDVSVFRLQTEDVSSVLNHQGRAQGAGIVPYEFLPHLNRLSSEFLEKVRSYSRGTSSEVIAVPDGGAVIHLSAQESHILGSGMKFVKGEAMPIGAAA